MRKMGLDILESILGRSEDRPKRGLKLVVGLGNPGQKYVRTRHNAGFWCVDRLAEESGITFSDRRRHAAIGEGMIAETPVALAKPRTFVNESGKAATFLLTRYRASPSDLLVIYDEMDLPPGSLRVRARGGSGGHKGMKSIIEAVGTQEIARVRIGIGRPSIARDDIQHVLGTMPPDERLKADEAVERAAEAVVSILTEGIDMAMERFN